MSKRVGMITFDRDDLASPNCVGYFTYESFRSSLYIRDLDLLLKVTGVNVYKYFV